MSKRRHPANITCLIPPKVRVSHKGTYGRVLVIAGSTKYTGAAVLAVEAALRSGVGMVVAVAIATVATVIRQRNPEVVVVEVPEQDGVITEAACEMVAASIEEFNVSAVCIGPGLGRVSDAFYRGCVAQCVDKKIPVVVDADALAPIYSILTAQHVAHQFVFTPHPKEFRRMLDTVSNVDGDTENNQENVDNNMVVKAAAKVGQTVVLKTHATVVSNGKDLWINETGNAGLATAGSGDVLAGLMGGLLAQGVECYNAAMLGVYMHGMAAEFAAETVGLRAMVASDVCDTLPKVFLDMVK
jgi:hydroxyethylthiazole kinase-like uncharacterized protein yjeF